VTGLIRFSSHGNTPARFWWLTGQSGRRSA